jgi:large subunit ribosomal protein L18
MEKNKRKERIRHRFVRFVEKNMHRYDVMLRVSVFPSGQHMHISLINDKDRRVVGGLSTLAMKDLQVNASTVAASFRLGALFAENILRNFSYDKIYFDRSGYRYHGRVKAVADGIRSVLGPVF